MLVIIMLQLHLQFILIFRELRTYVFWSLCIILFIFVLTVWLCGCLAQAYIEYGYFNFQFNFFLNTPVKILVCKI